MGQILSSCHFSDDVASMIKPGLGTNGFYPYASPQPDSLLRSSRIGFTQLLQCAVIVVAAFST